MVQKIFSEINSTFLKLIQKDYLKSKTASLFLAALILIIISVRIYSIAIPLTDRTAWKEIDYIAISQNYVLNGFSFFEPTISWPAEPPRVTAMEFPLVPYIAAILYKILGQNLISIRLITFVAFILIILILFKLVNREVGPFPALIAACMAGFIPLTSMFGNMLNTYPVAILTGLTAIYFFSRWLDNNKSIEGIIACTLFSLTLLLMPTELTILIPLTWLFYRKNGINIRSWKRMVLFTIIALIAPIIWYSYAYYLTKSSIDVFGVFGGHDKYQTIKMLTTKEWHFEMFRRFTVLLSGKVGLLIALFGLYVILFLKIGRLFLFYGFSFLAFILIVAEGNLDAPYRQFCSIPALSVFFGIGLTYIIACTYWLINTISNWSLKSSVIVAVALMLTCSYILIKNRYILFKRDMHNPVSKSEWILSKEIRNNSEPSSKLITAGTYTIHKGGNDLSPVIYYYADRQGWTLRTDQLNLNNIEILRKKGAVLLAIENISREKELEAFCETLKKEYRVIFQDNDLNLLLLDLKSR